MSQQDQVPAPSGDYGYDLAHDDLTNRAAPDAPAAHHAPAAPPRPCVTRQPEDAGGDLSYDLAHDVPPSTGR